MSKSFRIAITASVLAQTRMNQRATRSPATNKAIAYNSSIAKAMRKNNPVEVKSGKDMFSANNGKLQLKLAFLILTYLYSQDDLKLSKRELKDLKETVKIEAPEFSSDDLIEVYGFFVILPDANYVLRYIADNGIDDETFYSANSIVLDNYRDKKVYVTLLKELRDKYKSLNLYE